MRTLRLACWTAALLGLAGCGGSPASRGIGLSGSGGAAASSGAGAGGAASSSGAGAGGAADPPWSEAFGADAWANAVAVDPAGNIAVTGNFAGPMDLGDGVLTGAGDTFVASFDAGGHVRWARQFLGETDGEVPGQLLPASLSQFLVAADGAGRVILSGNAAGDTVDFGGGPTQGGDLALAGYDAAGGFGWSRRIGGSSSATATALAGLRSGGALVSGFFDGTVDFGPAALSSASGADAFVARLDTQGQGVWSRDIGPGALAMVAAGPADEAIVAGINSGPFSFAGEAATSAPGAFLGELDAGGEFVWAHAFAGSFASLAVASGAGIVIAGEIEGAVDFGVGPLGASGDGAFVAAFDGAGHALWSKALPSNDMDSMTGLAVAFGAGGDVLLAGNLFGTVDLGAGPLTGFDCPFLAVFGPDGAPLSSRAFGGASVGFLAGLASDATRDRAVLVGRLVGTTDFGSEALTGSPDGAFFLASVAP